MYRWRVHSGHSVTFMSQVLPSYLYRCDGSRSGITKTEIPATLSVCWETKLPTKPSAITAAVGKILWIFIYDNPVKLPSL